MPEHVRGTMRKIVKGQNAVYRDQQYVVGECQSLAAQLVAIVEVLKSNLPAEDRETRRRPNMS